jgi:hypothetical protein
MLALSSGAMADNFWTKKNAHAVTVCACEMEKESRRACSAVGGKT